MSLEATWRDKTAEALGVLLKNYKARVDGEIDAYLSSLNNQTKLKEAIAYSLQNGGKRFRPALVYMVAEALGKNDDTDNAALAIEFFHTASLIADDLPCMDNDEERRGRPSLHIIYGENTALLASYALIAAGYERIAACRPDVCIPALENASYNTGLFGASGGQYLDLNPPEPTYDCYLEVARNKTVSLFEVAFVFGWLCGGGSVSQLPLVKKAALHFGMAFQMADDLGDMAQDQANACEMNIGAILGVDEARRLVQAEIAGYKESLQQLGISSPALLSLCP